MISMEDEFFKNVINIRSTKYKPIIKQTFSPDYREFSYSRNCLYFGRTVDLEPIAIDFSESVVVFVLGERGSGKTWLLRGIMDRAFRSGMMPIVVSDLAPEYYTSELPLQDKFSKNLNKDEVSNGTPITNFYPQFLRHFDHSDNTFESIPIAFTFDDLTLFDFLTLIRKKLTGTQINAIEDAFKEKEKKKLLNLKEFLNYLKQNKNLEEKTVKSLRLAIKILVDYDIVNEQYSFDFIDVVKKNRVPILVLKGWTNLGDNTHYMAAFVALFVRKILQAKFDGLLPKNKKVVLIVPESSRFVPAESNPSSKKAILDAIDLGRKWGISLVLESQTATRIASAVIEQTKYLLLPYNIDINSAIEIFKRKGLLDVSPNLFGRTVREIMYPLRKYKDGKREWLFIDTDKKDWDTIVPFAPLSHHLEEMG